MEGWVCLAVNASFHRGDTRMVRAEMGRIFEGDLCDIRFVCDDALMASGEYFCLVRCKNYHDHIDSIASSGAVARVIPDCHNPSFLSEADVNRFCDSSVRSDKPSGDGIKVGDIVMVKPPVKPSRLGYLSGLYGIVYDVKPCKAKVLFHFHTRKMKKIIYVTSLSRVGSIVPSSGRVLCRRRGELKTDRAKEVVSHLDAADQVCRKNRRSLEAPYRRKRR